MTRPLIIAHRGDSSRALENSLEAIRLALSVPVDMIEIDIRKSADRELYLMHDWNTDRTADRTIDLEQSSSDQISHLRLNNGEPIPTLRDVFELVSGKVGLNIEIKSEGAGALCARQLLETGYDGPILISSFIEREVCEARQVMPGLETAKILNSFTTKEVSGYRAEGYSLVSLNKKALTENLLRVCHEQMIKVYVWTVDEEEEIRKFIHWGVDGIISNRPALLKELVEKLTR
jgi:glycerophosphoryl diester phosphodiesterase